MTQSALVKSMLENAVHIGHKREFWSHKMRDYIFGVQNGVHVFDLYKTAEKLEEAKKLLSDMTSSGKTVLFVGTKVQSKDLIETLATDTNHFYINSKWTAGLLTNFTTIKTRIKYYNNLEKDLESGMLDNLTKKEKAVKITELEKLREAYSGVKNMRKVPDLVVVIDGHYEELTLTEARKLSIPTLALLGSTGDIDHCDHFIPCNVNSVKSLAFILGELKGSISTRKDFAAKKTFSRTRTLKPKKS